MKTRFTDEQIIKLLKEHEAREGAADICRRYERWSRNFGPLVKVDRLMSWKSRRKA